VQTQYRDAQQNYGSDPLNQVIAKGYITKLLSNEAVKSFTCGTSPIFWSSLSWW